MKCIHCETDSKLKDRKAADGGCPACKHPFAFEPTTDRLGRVPLTDPLFKKAILDVSSEGSHTFTARQLWFELCRKATRRSLMGGVGCGTAALAVAGVAGVSFAAMELLPGAWRGLGALPVLAAVGGAAAGKPKPTPEPPIAYSTFQELYTRWRKAHGPPEKLLKPEMVQPQSRERNREPDLTAYSFDRCVVTDRDDLAAMLVANRFHFENNCAILSAAGYPGEISETILIMLRRNPKLKVFAVHDASADGCRLPLKLKTPQWFGERDAQIIDLGLRPSHAQSLGLFTENGVPTGSTRDLQGVLPETDLQWVTEGHRAEVSQLRPARLMRSIYQGFTRAEAMDTDGGAVWVDSGGIWFYDSGLDVTGADSFG